MLRFIFYHIPAPIAVFIGCVGGMDGAKGFLRKKRLEVFPVFQDIGLDSVNVRMNECKPFFSPNSNTQFDHH